ncbi:MAG TPA: hypothetical protein VEK57_15700 [Thermoanaerobaculia bacterium]|nr:hypothetical protein [Thermoanaerobaculia bacterium]
MSPRQAVEQGMVILAPALLPAGFRASAIEEGIGSGGPFATVRYIRGDRMLELHFRHSLGMVRYHIGAHHASHPSYMRAATTEGEASYPGFSTDPLVAFEHLRSDLERFASDFLHGDGAALLKAAISEEESEEQASHKTMIESVGDGRCRRDARDAFRRKDYARTVSLLSELRYPEDLSPAERQMLEIARQRA